MIDFESFGIGRNAAIVQVGASYFDRNTGAIGPSFKRNIDARSSVRSGGEMDADTIYWWLNQSAEAIESITGGHGKLDHLADVMRELNEFLSTAENIWSHATFDFVILEETLKRLSIKPLFPYWAARDIRTLCELARINPRDKRFVRTGVHHDALDDCEFQIQYCVAALRKIDHRMNSGSF